MPRLEYVCAPGHIFFNNEAADVSLHGTFTDAERGEVWDDGQIRDFIRGGRPDLFKSLQKLPVPPEGLPQPVDLGSNHLSPDEHILMNQSALIEDGSTRGHYSPSSTAQHHHAILYRTRTVMLQHKRHIQSRLLSKTTATQVSLVATLVSGADTNIRRWSRHLPSTRSQAWLPAPLFGTGLS